MPQVHTLDRVVIRFAGDSGDGMQLTGDRFTADAAVFGNDISTLPNFPAEIRAPAGTLPGVSSFQLHFANYDIMTPGDRPDVLVAMNPAALKANLADLAKGGVIIADTSDFTKRNLAKVGYGTNPLDDGSLTDYQLHALDLTGMTVEAVKQFGLTRKDASRAKNMFALGLLSWLYGRPTEGTTNFLARKFASKPAIRDANHHRLQDRVRVRGDHRDVRRHLRGGTGADAGREVPPDLRQPGVGVRLDHRGPQGGPAAVPRRLPDHPGVRRPARAEQAQALRGHHLPGRGRDRRRRRGPRGQLRRPTRRHHHLRTGRGAEGRDDRPRGDDRASAGRLRHPTRRSQHRDAHQDRAGRPAAGHVRPQRRGPGARAGRAVARPTASRPRSRRSVWPCATARR